MVEIVQYSGEMSEGEMDIACGFSNLLVPDPTP